MTELNGFDQALHDLRGLLLRVTALFEDAIEEFTTRAKLHDEVDVGLIFKNLMEANEVGMVREELHDANFTKDIMDMARGREAEFRNGFTSEREAGRTVDTGTDDAELATTQFRSKVIKQCKIERGG